MTGTNYFICPICKENLIEKNRALVCKNSHCYDISKHGYVNLLRSQKSSKKRRGDDKLMLRSRHDFLEKGFYQPLLDAIKGEVIKKFSTAEKNNDINRPFSILDMGCGEGYYTANIHNALENSAVYGIDISKNALIYAAKRDRGLKLAAASCTDIPVESGCFDAVLNIFSPTAEAEFYRVLKNDGVLIKAVPLENHLFGLKRAVYDNPYKNKAENFELDCFKLRDFLKIKYTQVFTANEDIITLFKMTPYYYKTSRTDQAKLEILNQLETEIEFGVLVYEKQ